MKKHRDILMNTATLLITSIVALPAVSDTESPFQIREYQKSTDSSPKSYEGMCGGCGGNWEGRCGGMMGGRMMGGAMPPSFDPSQLPEPKSADAKLVTKFCAQCHGLPSPEQHTAEGWPVTVTRMNTRMQWMDRNNSPMNIIAPSEDELSKITAYLVKHAAKPQE